MANCPHCGSAATSPYCRTCGGVPVKKPNFYGGPIAIGIGVLAVLGIAKLNIDVASHPVVTATAEADVPSQVLTPELLISHCGKPDSDKTKKAVGSLTRTILFKKPDVAVVFRGNVDSAKNVQWQQPAFVSYRSHKPLQSSAAQTKLPCAFLSDSAK